MCTLLRRRMRTLSTYIYLTALCLSNIVALVSVIMFEGEMFLAPSRQNCSIVLTAKAFGSSTFALSTWWGIDIISFERYFSSSSCIKDYRWLHGGSIRDDLLSVYWKKSLYTPQCHLRHSYLSTICYQLFHTTIVRSKMSPTQSISFNGHKRISERIPSPT